ncbi:MAG TPA: acyl-protein synthetase, partial [Candidatus Wallbacteria bacterium]|nr:acyl-protein synthetase [Candidatus Wallbacteria bacterium]
MKYIEKIFKNADAFGLNSETRADFIEAMREAVDFHRSNSKIYDGICSQHNFSFDRDIKGESDLYKIPHIMVNVFKEMKLLSVPESEITLSFTSSGTTGSISQTNLDNITRERQAFTRRSTVESYNLASYEEEVNYLCFSYDPETGGAKGAAHTHTAYMGFAKAHETFYAISRDEKGEAKFKINDCIAALERYSKSGLPLRITGFPSFGYTTLKKLDEMEQRFSFPASSVLFSGGGWKLPGGDPISFDEYSGLVKRVLGIPRDRIRDVFGMIEHGIPYMTCGHGNFHVPIYSRVFAVDPASAENLPNGRTGLLKLITPYIRSVPAISILSTDYGVVENNCPCL